MTTEHHAATGAFASGSSLLQQDLPSGWGNIWKFPYITGENGGGAFVLIYLICIAVVGLPILIGELMIGKASQQSTVPAFRSLSKPSSAWMSFGWMGIIASFILLSYYAVVAGWTMHYAWLAMSGAFTGASAENITNIFGEVVSSPQYQHWLATWLHGTDHRHCDSWHQRRH